MRSRGGAGGKGPKGIGQDGRSFPLSQEGESETPARPSEPEGAQPSNMAAQRLPFPRDGTACRAEGGARQLYRHAHNECEGEAEP
jgi:hypothetical protein